MGLNRLISAYSSGFVELPGFSENLDNTIGKAIEKAARRVVGNVAAVHLQNVLCDRPSSIRLDKSARGRGPEEMVRDGAKCLGWESAKWNSRWRSSWVISRYSKVMCGLL